MLRILLTTIFISIFFTPKAQKPPSGTYTYTIAFVEWNEKSLGATCTVIIHGDSITVVHNGTKKLSGKKGDILDRGIILQHTKTGKWIGQKPKDKDAPNVGGCSDGPSIIDFKRKRFLTC
jgi:hypothetical protein